MIDLSNASSICDLSFSQLHRKLDMLKEGKVFVPTPDDLERKDSMKADAEKAGIEAWIQP